MKNQKEGIILKNTLSSRREGERRIVSIDLLAVAGAKIDRALISISRLGTDGEIDIAYIENPRAKNLIEQSLRVKQLYAEFCTVFEGDIVTFDISNIGIALYDGLTSQTRDESSDMFHSAMLLLERISIDGISDYTYKQLTERSLSKSGIMCIYPTTRGNYEYQKQKKKIRLEVISEIAGECKNWRYE